MFLDHLLLIVFFLNLKYFLKICNFNKSFKNASVRYIFFKESADARVWILFNY